MIKQNKQMIIPSAMFFLFSIAYSLLSIFHHWHFRSGAFDLGLQDQAIWNYSKFQTPYCPMMNLNNILGDHFNPVQVLLAPIYWIVPHVEALLVTQAVLLMLPIFPIYFISEKLLGRYPAFAFTFAYSACWGIQSAAYFDFHEMSIAVPLVAFAIYFIDRNKWNSLYFTIALLIFTKEDMCLVVSFIGFYLILLKQFKRGLSLMLVGIFTFILVMEVLIPYFLGPTTNYRHWAYTQLGEGPFEAVVTIITKPFQTISLILGNKSKLETLLALFMPFIFLSFFSKISVVLIPLLMERMLSDNPLHWQLDINQYSAVPSLIICMAAVDGLNTISKMAPNKKQIIVRMSSIIIVIGCILMLAITPLRKLVQPSFYYFSIKEKIGVKALNMIPNDASVLSQNTIVPHLTHRKHINNIKESTMVDTCNTDYIIACEGLNTWPLNSYEPIKTFINNMSGTKYAILLRENGWVVLKRKMFY